MACFDCAKEVRNEAAERLFAQARTEAKEKGYAVAVVQEGDGVKFYNAAFAMQEGYAIINIVGHA